MNVYAAVIFFTHPEKRSEESGSQWDEDETQWSLKRVCSKCPSCMYRLIEKKKKN